MDPSDGVINRDNNYYTNGAEPDSANVTESGIPESGIREGQEDHGDDDYSSPITLEGEVAAVAENGGGGGGNTPSETLRNHHGSRTSEESPTNCANGTSTEIHETNGTNHDHHQQEHETTTSAITRTVTADTVAVAVAAAVSDDGDNESPSETAASLTDAENNIAENNNISQEEQELAPAVASAVAAAAAAAVTSEDGGVASEDGGVGDGDNVSAGLKTPVPEPPVVPSVIVDIPSDTDRNVGRKLIGKKVRTSLGDGVVSDFRSSDSMYVIRLERRCDKQHKNKNKIKTYQTGMLYTPNIPEPVPEDPAQIAFQLNVAYEALEKMRRLNLDVQCHELGIPADRVDHDTCTSCLLANRGVARSSFPRLQRFVESAHETTTDLDNQVKESMPRLHSFFNPALSASASTTTKTTKAKTKTFGTTRPSTTNSTAATAARASLQRLVESANETANDFDNQVSNFFGVNANLGRTSLFGSRTSATASSSSSSSATLANSVSASLQRASAASGLPGAGNPVAATTTTTTKTTAMTASSSEADGTLTTTDSKSTATATNTAATKTPQSSRSSKQSSAAAAAAATAPPQTNQGFQRMRKFWGTIQSLPQPSPQTKPPPLSSTKKTINTSSATEIPASNSSSTSTPTKMGIQGFLNNSVTTTIFGENKVKEDGSSADPNIIMHNRISIAQDTVPNPKKKPVKSDKPVALPRIQRLINKRKEANTSPCLICASPSCPKCSSASFRKEGITLCHKCERLFELDFIVDCVSTSDPTERAERIEYMVDCYDRCMLLLRYSTQFVEQIAASLEDQTKKQDIIGLASSSVGVLSGVLGIAAAASILTPAGPPLLIASLFFGGSATTVQSGTEALNFLSEPRKLADRIIALHGMSLSILRVTSTLRDAMLRDHIRTDVYEVEAVAASKQVAEGYEKAKTGIVMGSNFGRSLTLGATTTAARAGVAGATEISVVTTAGTAATAAGTAANTAATAGATATARGATALSRAGTAAARTIRFARFAGGALSAAVLVMEANAIHSTVKSIKDGSPSDKAETLRGVMKEMDDFPSTTDLDDECQSYLTVLASRPEPPVEIVAMVTDDDGDNDDIPEAACQQVVEDNSQLSAPGATILDAVNNGPITHPAAANANTTEAQYPEAAALPVDDNNNTSSSRSSRSAFLEGSSVLFQRLQTRRDDRQAAAEEVIAVAVADDQLGESNFSLVL